MTIIMEDGCPQNLVTIYGSSSDEKPTIYADGSIFIATDTQAVYMYDEANTTWRQLS